MLIGIGSDHLGLDLKHALVHQLAQRGYDVRDFGTRSHQPVDYPDIAVMVAEAVRAGMVERGILVCGSGLGMAITACKVGGILASPVSDIYTARLARERNHTQIISLGANVVGPGLAGSIAEAWLSAEFQYGDSARKVAKILALDERHRPLDLPIPAWEEPLWEARHC